MLCRSNLELAGTVSSWPAAGLGSDHLLGFRNDLCKCTSVGHSSLPSVLGYCFFHYLVVV